MEIITTAYMAKDGTIFRTIDECNEYEDIQEGILNNLESDLFDSVISGTAEIQQKLGSISLDKINLNRSSSIKEFSDGILNGNIILIKKKIDRNFLEKTLSNELKQEEVFLKICEILDTHRVFKPTFFLKIDTKWYSANELIKKNQETIRSIESLTITLFKKYF